jgi:hypothetical protein
MFGLFGDYEVRRGSVYFERLAPAVSAASRGSAGPRKHPDPYRIVEGTT